MKRLKLILGGFIFALAFVSSIFIYSNNVSAIDTDKIYIHFQSSSAKSPTDYSNYRYWVWVDSGAGVLRETTSYDDFGAVVEVAVTSSTQKVGWIACKDGKGTDGSKDWPGGTKDAGADIFVVLANLKEDSGTYNAYLISGMTTVFTSSKISSVITSAAFTDLTTIKVNVFSTNYSTAPTFKVKANDVEIASTLSSYSKSGVATLTVASAELSKSYTVEATINGDDCKQTVSFDGLYDSKAFDDQFYYSGKDLGATYAKGSTSFKLWAPISTSVVLNLYTKGHTTAVRNDGVNTPYKQITMTRGDKGVWSCTENGDLENIYYTYSVTNGTSTNEVVDPYAKSTGVNGARGMVVNFESATTTPEGWSTQTIPSFSGNYVDAIIYELHVRDLTSSKTWTGTEKNRGKFLGVAESGTTYSNGEMTVTTGLDHLQELGITHVQILPSQDYQIVDETKLTNQTYIDKEIDGIFNWGYMTQNFNTLEGSYSTDPYDGAVRIYEFRKMIQALHNKGIRVNMDVVYNHTAQSSDSNFNNIIPGYYHRMTSEGFSNGSGCGNETASNRSMVSKFIVDSTSFYVQYYEIDGFRFDLMSLHDYSTMNAVYDSASKIEDKLMVYGEPWTGGTTTLSSSEQATKSTMDKMPNIGSFCDYSRDGYKGTNQAFEDSKVGFLFDSKNTAGAKFGISGGTVGSSSYTYTSPNQQINYIECHDNATLCDKAVYYKYCKNTVTNWPGFTNAQVISYLGNKQTQGGSLLLLSQGTAFLDSGLELLRSKKGNGNTYNVSDKYNALDWSNKIRYNEIFQNYKTLINIRKNHESLTLETYDKIKASLTFVDETNTNYLAYEIKSSTDSWQDYFVYHNTSAGSTEITLDSECTLVYSSKVYGSDLTIDSKYTTLTLGANESVILVKTFGTVTPEEPAKKGNGCSSKSFVSPESVLGLLGVCGLGIGLYFVIKPKKEEGIM